MANRYNQWVGSSYVGLPVDYYQSALLLKDQRTQESLDKINGIIGAYGQIQAISPDAEAFYNQTIDQLKTSVEAVGKETLTTPQAQRKVNQLVNDPTIVGNLDKVYSDALYASEARKQMNEYLKKNPNVNAVDYMVAFNNLGKETGDPTKFNHNRFRNMPALSDYFDLNKTIADEVTKLKANEEEVKRIMGNKYVSYKQSGVLEDRIRDLAVSRVMADPQAKAQFERNVRYTDYLSDPYDINAGQAKTAQTYRLNIAKNKVQIKDQLDAMLAGKTQDQINANPQLKQAQVMAERTLKDYESLDTLDDGNLNQKMYMDAFAHSFDPYAYKTSAQAEEWTPAYIQQLRDSAADARLRRRLAAQKKTIEDALTVKPLTSPDTRQQMENTPGNWNDYIKERIPALSDVRLNSDGSFTADAYGKTDFAWVNMFDFAKGGGYKNHLGVKYFNRSDIKLSDSRTDEELTKQGYKFIGFTGGGGSNGPNKGPEKMVYALDDTPSYKEIPKDKGALYEKGKEQIKQYLNKLDLSGGASNYNLDSQEGVKKAIQDIVGFNQTWESEYSTIYQLGASNTNSGRNSVAAIVPNSLVKKNGKTADKSDKTLLQSVLNGSNDKIKNVSVGFKIRSRDFPGEPVYSIKIGKDSYELPMHQEYQQMLGPMSQTIDKIVKGKSGVITQGDNLIINGLEGGQRVNGVFTGGATPQYQQKAKEMFDENVKELEAVGFTHEAAVKKLRTTANQAADYMREGNAFPITNDENGKTAYIKNAVGQYTPAGRRPSPIYYSFSQIGNSKVMSIGEMFYENMSEFGSAKNPYMNLPLLDLLKNKNTINLFSAGFGADDDELPEY